MESRSGLGLRMSRYNTSSLPAFFACGATVRDGLAVKAELRPAQARHVVAALLSVDHVAALRARGPGLLALLQALEGEVVRVEAAPPAEAGGVQARVQAVVRNGSVAELVLLEAGAGYSAAELEGEATPRLRIAPPAQAGQGGGPPRPKIWAETVM